MNATPGPARQRGWWFAAAAVGLLITGIALGEWLGWPFLATPLETRLSQTLGRQVRFSVDNQQVAGTPAEATAGTTQAASSLEQFSIRFIGGVRLQLPAIEIAAPAWSSAPYTLRASNLRLALDYTDLWQAYTHDAGDPPLRIARLQAETLDAWLHRLADGRASWQWNADNSSTASAQTAQVPVFGFLEVKNGRLHYDDALLASQLDIRLSLIDGAQATSSSNRTSSLQANALGHYRNQPLKAQLVSDGLLPWLSEGAENAPVAFSLNATVGRASLVFKGSALDALTLRGLTGRFNLKGPSLAAAGEPLGVTLPTTAAFKTDGWIGKKGSAWRVVVDDATVGASRLTGAFVFETGGPLPVLSGRLDGSRLLLADLGPAVGVLPANSATATTTADKKVLPAVPFDLAALRAMNANVLVDISEVDLNTRLLEPLRPLHMHLLLNSGVLTFQDLKASTAQGQLMGRLVLDGRAAQAVWNADVRWDGVRLERWLRLAREGNAPPYVSGRLNGNAVLQGRGRSTAEILASLKGRARSELLDGSISHLVVEAAGIDIAQALGVLIAGDDALPVQCGVIDLLAEGGVFRPRVMVLDTSDSAIWINGSLSLANESLDLQAVVIPKDFSPLTLRTPLRIKGSFAQPSVSLEKQALGLKLAGVVLLALVNPLAALLPLIDTGDAEKAQRGASGCQRLAQRAAAQRTAPARAR